MAQNDLDTLPASLYITLITFTYWTQTVRYAASKKSFTDAGTNVYTALPTAVIDMKRQTGGSKDEPISISMLASTQPIANMLRGYPHATVTVLVEELNPTDEATRRPLWKGIITKVKSNRSGRADMAEIEVAGWRSFLTRPLGIPATNTCAWVLGDKNCQKDISSLGGTPTITTIDGPGLVVTGIGSFVAGYFTRGYLEFQGLRMLVKDHHATTGIKLSEEPPPEWLGATVAAVPGCNKSKLECTDKFNNIANFGGMGIGIPTYHPVYETV